MVIKKTLYPKTERVKLKNFYYATEKLDGSNLGIFKLDGEIYLALRNNIVKVDENIEDAKILLYNGLFNWISEYKDFFVKSLYEGSVVFGEWIGMGKIKYEFKNRFHIFAKARIDKEFKITKMNWDLETLKFVFDEQVVPSFISKVPLTAVFEHSPSVEELNCLYEEYCTATNRKVEGFVIRYGDKIRKYVRLKNGKLTEHKENAYVK